MTTTTTAPEERGAEARQHSRLRIAAAAVAFVALGLIGWAGYTWSHPTLLGSLTKGGETSQTFGPSQSLKTLYAGLTFPEAGSDRSETITFSSATASVSSNTAGATVVIAVCERVPGSPPIGTASDDTIGTYCTAVRPVTDGTQLRLGDEQTTDYLVVVMTPARPGSTQMDRVTYSYARGWKHFHQQGADSVPASFRLKVER